MGTSSSDYLDFVQNVLKEVACLMGIPASVINIEDAANEVPRVQIDRPWPPPVSNN